MPAIELAFDGRQDMLKYAFGGGGAADDQERAPISADEIKKAFRSLKGKR